ncbi:Gldg family protein [Chitinophaga sp. YIM B06452]|uniref:ABC transporter permease subunit n=1 Tax=Chitinophaga sp. YIM B06452 TaxID=3082158 RepID=UPI0031FE6C46
MGIIIKIAKAELRSLFYSPIAWFLTVVFFVVCGIQFVNPIVVYSRIQDVMLQSDPKWIGFDDIAGLSFNMFSGVYGKVVENLYLFLPLLTMGVINREIQSGSIKMLYSSPVRTREIVLGKYLGLMGFNMVLLVSIALLLLTGWFSIINADYKAFLSALLAIFLLSNTYAAIGLFLSSLTSYQILAGVLTFAVFFALKAVQWLWQDYDFFRDLTWFLSISNRTEQMLGGMITTRDVAYFLLIIAMFLSFACIRLKSTQESRSWRVSFFRYAGVSLLVLMLGYFSSRPGYVGYLDVTTRKTNTLHPATQAVIKELDGSPLKVTLYTNLLGKNARTGFPNMRNPYIWHFWESMRRFYPNIDLKYEYYYDFKDGDSSALKTFNAKDIHEVADKVAEILDVRLSLFKKPEEIRKQIDLSKEEYGLVMLLEYKGKRTYLRTYQDDRVWPDQNHISGSIRRLARDTVPAMLFTTGHYERNPYKFGERDYGPHTRNIASRNALVNKGVDADTVSLLHSDIPDSTDILVVADPRSALDTVEQRKILAYLESGKDAILYAEPGKQQMLNPILNTIGVNADNGVIVTENLHNQPHYMMATMTPNAHYMALEQTMFDYQVYKKDLGVVYQVGTANLSFRETNGFKAEPIFKFKGNNKTWIETGIFVADSAAPVFSKAEGDVQKDEYITAIKLIRKINNREQRIIVTGDGEFMTSLRQDGGNFGNGGYSWLLDNEYPVYHNTPKPKDTFLRIGKHQAKILWFSYVYILPGLILLSGTVILTRRKRK